MEGVRQCGNVSKSLYIYHPTKNTFQKPDSIDLSLQRVDMLDGTLLSYYLWYGKGSCGSRVDEDKVQMNEEIVHGRV